MMLGESQRQAIRQLAEAILTEESAELVELGVHQHGGQLLVKFLIDKVGGVTIQDCTRLNQRISQALDEAGWLEQRYTLEVSSPGLDRPLLSKRDFERAIGEDIELQLLETGRGTKQITGQLLAVQQEAIVLITPSGNLVIPLTQIQRALKAIRW